MTPAPEFRAAISLLGLRQTDFARLLSHLSGEKPNAVTVNRWAKGTRSVPPTVTAILRLLAMLPQRTREQLYRAAGCKGY